MRCACGSGLQRVAVEEWDDVYSFLRYTCHNCEWTMGVETDNREASVLFDRPTWTDEARYCLERLPPYVEPLVRQEVETYAGQHAIKLISTGLMTEARNRGAVFWHPDAETRLERVPEPVRAMARRELERTALGRDMPEVTVALMDEIKARYFGMGAQTS